jgi:hypothetical protein
VAAVRALPVVRSYDRGPLGWHPHSAAPGARAARLVEGLDDRTRSASCSDEDYLEFKIGATLLPPLTFSRNLG